MLIRYNTKYKTKYKTVYNKGHNTNTKTVKKICFGKILIDFYLKIHPQRSKGCQ